MFKIMLGKPEVQDYWDELVDKVKSGTASKDEKTIISIEPHPNSGKSNAYDRITLSGM